MKCSTIEIYSDSSPEFHTVSTPKARCTHTCSECGRVVEIGETYERVFGKWDGYTGTYKTCFECLSIRAIFFEGDFEYGGILEYLHEHINEMSGDISEDCIAPLTPKAQGYVCDLINEWWGE